jgi:tRNA G10  N-methylase Trm11
LSIAEISQVLKEDFRVVELSTHILIIESQKELPAEKLQQRFGGTIKIGQIIKTSANQDLLAFRADIIDLLKQARLDSAAQSRLDKKIFFGFSLYPLAPHELLNKYHSQIKVLAMETKKALKKISLSSRWVSSKDESLSSVVVQKNKLLTQGAEFCFLVSHNKIYLAKTLSCQQVDEYSHYDFGRPARSMKQGMLPPKLAKIMINLAQAPQTGLILDPFCGAGTILQEAIMMGYRHLIATDIDDQAIARTSANIDWLVDSHHQALGVGASQQKIDFSDFNLKIFPADVRILSQLLPADSVDVIVTEPYLGPVDKNKDSHQIRKIITELSELYLAAFRELKQILKKDGRLVMAFPVYKHGQQLNYLPIIKEIKEYGWQVVSPLPSTLIKSPIIKLTERQSIIYSRPDQQVLREIFIFRR